jgi:hypothetical protein
MTKDKLNHIGAAAGLSDLACNAFRVRSLTPAPVVRILRPVLRGAGLIKNSSQQSLILLIYSSFQLIKSSSQQSLILLIYSSSDPVTEVELPRPGF